MQETRRARIESVIKEELSVLVPREVKDPRVPMITLTNVVLTPDGSQATVYISIFGSTENGHSSEEMKNCLAGLTSASGYLRRHIARVLNTKHIPTLIFKEDKGLANSLRVHELLKKIADENREA